MDNLPEILEFIWSKGWVAVLVVILILLIHDPDRAEKIRELLFLPLFRLCKRGSRQYVAAKVGYTSTQFMKKEILPLLPSAANVKIQVQWVRSPSDPVLCHTRNTVPFLAACHPDHHEAGPQQERTELAGIALRSARAHHLDCGRDLVTHIDSTSNKCVEPYQCPAGPLEAHAIRWTDKKEK
jgi:hypothetical protein